MYSKAALLEIFQNILQFEVKVKKMYDDCIEKLEDKDIINILQSISNEEKNHIELAKPLLDLIKE
jgi:rubrerythrin